jgi:hypothetical protein
MASRNSRIAILVFSGLGFVSLANGADKVRVSVTNYNMSYLAAGVAAKKGIFKEDGLAGSDRRSRRCQRAARRPA